MLSFLVTSCYGTIEQVHATEGTLNTVNFNEKRVFWFGLFCDSALTDRTPHAKEFLCYESHLPEFCCVIGKISESYCTQNSQN